MAAIVVACVGCGKFGYGSFASQLKHSMDKARADGEVHAQATALSTPAVDQLLERCAPPKAEGPWGSGLAQGVESAGVPHVQVIAAHARSVRMALRHVQLCLFQQGDHDMYSAFLTGMRTAFPPGFVIENPPSDLNRLLQTIQSTAHDARGAALLQIYGQAFLRQMDSFGVLRRRDAAAPVSPLLAPEGPEAAASVEVAGGVATARLRRMDDADSIVSLVSDLQAAAGRDEVTALLLDLRSAAGSDPAALQPLRDALPGLVAAKPMAVWVDSLTRGTAEEAAAAARRQSGALVMGGPSLGYVFRRCSKDFEVDGVAWSLDMLCGAPTVLRAPQDARLDDGQESANEARRLNALGIDLNTARLTLSVAAAGQPIEEGYPAPPAEALTSVRVSLMNSMPTGPVPAPIEERARAAAAAWAQALRAPESPQP
ncbi:MAG TPA: hypothetical protein VL588_10850 [Bdellovibrionota bacterium]|nr:hypothetical protein [Bdellovibrionota bacterium]